MAICHSQAPPTFGKRVTQGVHTTRARHLGTILEFLEFGPPLGQISPELQAVQGGERAGKPAASMRDFASQLLGNTIKMRRTLEGEVS